MSRTRALPAAMSGASSSASKLAVTVPPTPPPTMTTSSTVLPPPSAGPRCPFPRLGRCPSAGLLHHEAGDVPLFLRGKQLVPGLFHPLGDVDLGTQVGGQDRHHLALFRCLQGPDELHEGSRAGAAPSVDFPVHHVLGHV